jgi:hypothetical protein
VLVTLTSQTFKLFITSPSALMIWFSHCCRCNRSAVNFNFVPQILQCSWFYGIHCSWNHPIGKSLMVSSQAIRVDTSHFLFVLSMFLGFHFSYRKMWWTPVSRHQYLTDYLGDCVKAVILSQHFHHHLNCKVFQSIACSHFSQFHQSWTYHATMQMLHVLIVVFQIHLSVFAMHFILQ